MEGKKSNETSLFSFQVYFVLNRTRNPGVSVEIIQEEGILKIKLKLILYPGV